MEERGARGAREAVPLSELLIILALILANGVFAGSEIAIVALRRSRIEELVEEGSGAARALKSLRDDPERFLATVQVGITVVGATAAAFGGAALAEDLEPWLRRVGWLAPYASEIALGLVILLISYLSLVVGELVPKSLALRASERYALLMGRPLLAISRVAAPVVWLLTQSSNLILRAFGDRTTFTETRLSPEELRQVVDEATKAGTLDPRAGEIASRALDLGELIAMEVMVPRTEVVAIEKDASPEEIRDALLRGLHSRLPVYEQDIDHILGYVTSKDLWLALAEGRTPRLDEILRPAYFVPGSMPAVELLHELRRRRMQIAIIVDEQGGTAGIATMEDILEELVGEIFSERDVTVPEPLRPEPDGSVLVQGSVPIRDVNRELGLDLPEEDGWTTVAGLVLSLAGRIPARGERFVAEDGTVLQVVDSTARRIRLLRLSHPERRLAAALEEG